MKILVFDTRAEQQPAQGPLGAAELYPDSSVIISHKPLFLPDWCDNYASTMAVAARVCRLGKNVAERFAVRYWREITACMITGGCGSERNDALARSFDGAIALGEWVLIDRASQAAMPFTASKGSDVVCSCNMSDDMYRLIDRAIVTASRYVTIKMGDIIAVTLGEACPIAIGDTLLATIGGQEVLTTRIK